MNLKLEFGKIFNLTRGSIGSYEEGRAEPKIETLKEIAKKFSITMDSIITTELTVNQLSGFSPENVVALKSSEIGAIGLPSILPKTLRRSPLSPQAEGTQSRELQLFSRSKCF